VSAGGGGSEEGAAAAVGGVSMRIRCLLFASLLYLHPKKKKCRMSEYEDGRYDGRYE
jgi:hypothetical protein